ncbi:MAG: hypothetical protein ACREUO_11600 [Burkholderiales bacterium]
MRLLAAALLACALPAAAQDYEREKRWAAEVVPNLVVGEAVYLKLPAGREFLGLFTEARNPKIAILLVHGVGVHPDHGVIGSLRVALAEGNVRVPVLDLCGENDIQPVLRADWRRRFTLNSIPGSRQVRIVGADHHSQRQGKGNCAAVGGFIVQLTAK